MTRVLINPRMMRWAFERGGFTLESLDKSFPKLRQWESGEIKPTLNQIEHFAKTVHVPIGFLFLDEPPTESVPIPDFRTSWNKHKTHPSPDLLDTIFICQQRQEWFNEYSRTMGDEPLHFVGSVTRAQDISEVANNIRDVIGFSIEKRRALPTWTDALRTFIEQSDAAGILVMCSGVVLNNSRRPLNTEEFRGFAITDSLAPLIFINGADTKAAQMFTIAHELAHIWLGQSAISDVQPQIQTDHEIELWCNSVAAELLVPMASLQSVYDQNNDILFEINRLARYFKVSTLVILRRIFDYKKLTQEEFWDLYDQELERLRTIPRRAGGNFYLTQSARVSKRFARALVISTLEGQTLHRDAFRMLGFTKISTFHELGRSLGIMI